MKSGDILFRVGTSCSVALLAWSHQLFSMGHNWKILFSPMGGFHNRCFCSLRGQNVFGECSVKIHVSSEITSKKFIEILLKKFQLINVQKNSSKSQKCLQTKFFDTFYFYSSLSPYFNPLPSDGEETMYYEWNDTRRFMIIKFIYFNNL